MSLHSTRSSRGGKGASYGSASEANVYQFALRTAYLSYLVRPRPVAESDPEDDRPSSPNSASNHDGGSSAPVQGRRERLQGALASATKMPDLTSMFVGGGNSGKADRSSKFSEKTFKALDEKLRLIFMGKDAGYQDQRIRRTIATFWSNTNDPSYLRGVRENRKIEELILMMVSVATKELQKEVKQVQDKGSEPDFDWKYELNIQVGQIVQILRETVKSVNSTSPDLVQKLDSYSNKLAATPLAKPAHPTASSSAPSSPAPASLKPRKLSRAGPSSASVAHVNSSDPVDMPMVLTVGRLFGKSDAELAKDIGSIKSFCTEKAAMVDLKTCLKNINASLPFPGQREDFDSEEAWQTWRQAELTHLSQLVMVMIQINPDLAKQNTDQSDSSDSSSANPPLLTDRSDSVYSQFMRDKRGSSTSNNGVGSESTSRNPSVKSTHSTRSDAVSAMLQDVDEDRSGQNFTFIPPNPRTYYRRLIECCIDYDLEAMATLPEDQEVTLSILSTSHIELTNECAIRWRLGHPHRVATFLDVIRLRFEREEVPMECIPEALGKVMQELKRTPLEQWMWQDSGLLLQVLSTLWDHFLRALHYAFEDIAKVKQADIAEFVFMLEELRETHLIGMSDQDRRKLVEIVDSIRQRAFSVYSMKTTDVFSEDAANEVEPLLTILDWVEKQAKIYKKRFPSKILDHINVVGTILGQQVPLFLQDLEDAHPRVVTAVLGAPSIPPVVDIEEAFHLYRRSCDLLTMHEQHCPDSGVEFDLGAFFEPFARQWLAITDGLTSQWVAEAIRVDTFEPDGDAGNSSSVVDLFGSFSSALDFLYGLNWPDEHQEAQFLTILSRTLSKVMEQYCNTIEELFLAEMFPRVIVDPNVSKENAWIVKAKLTLQGEKKIEPFNFVPASCVKVNNIETARLELDRMYKKMQVDEVIKIIESVPPTVPSKDAPGRFLFTVKIVLAEGLVPNDKSSTAKLDTFVTLSDQHGDRLAKTRTVYESLDPRWDQTFDISVERSLWLMATVRDRALVGKHDEIGRAYIKLDPQRYGDFLTHEVWYDLEDNSGRILLRISMEGEKDEIGFYFGRAFRTLKRAESEMIRTIVDKMTPMIRQSLTQKVIKALTKSTALPIDYNETINKLTDRFKSALGTSSESAIPLPKAEQVAPSVARPRALTDIEIEAAINDLFDYLDVNQATLSSTLSLDALHAVMMKLWKEILTTLEGLLIPPLSASPTDMTPLTDKEVDIVMKWREFLRDYFHAQGDEKGLSKETLHNPKYNELMSIRMHYDWSTDALMEQCVRDSQASLRKAGTVKRAKSVFQQRNLGTIRSAKKDKKKESSSLGNADIILRILRMRGGAAVQEFIAEQIAFKDIILKQAAEAASRPQPLSRPSASGVTGKLRLGSSKRTSKYGGSSIPPVPALPEMEERSARGYQLRDERLLRSSSPSGTGFLL